MVQELTAARDELQRQTEEATGTCKVLETQLTNMTEVLEGEKIGVCYPEGRQGGS